MQFRVTSGFEEDYEFIERLAPLHRPVLQGDGSWRGPQRALSDRIENVFSSEDQDAMDRDGPCLPKPRGYATARNAASTKSWMAR